MWQSSYGSKWPKFRVSCGYPLRVASGRNLRAACGKPLIGQQVADILCQHVAILLGQNVAELYFYFLEVFVLTRLFYRQREHNICHIGTGGYTHLNTTATCGKILAFTLFIF